MKKNRFFTVILFVIICCALFLRTFRIAHNPPSLSWDEVSIGYNAYSILKTGRDEHGQFMPVAAFAAYGDYKPPLAIYITVPFVALFGLNELAVRLPSALFGTATVFLAYVLVCELFPFQKKNKYIDSLPLISAFVLAISPWHINISRAGFEANIALFFVLLGSWILLTTGKHPKRLLIAWLPFVASMYTFNSARYFVAFLGIGILVYIRSVIRHNSKIFAAGVLIAIIAVLPLLPHLLSKQARLRYEEVNIFTDSSVVVTANERLSREGNNPVGKLVNNRRVGYARSYLIHFFDNLQPNFLFIQGDGNPKFSTQDVGQLYIMEAPLLIIGIFSMFTVYPGVATLLLYWMLTAFIPAATARETPHALRILNSLPSWHIFIAFGLWQSVNSIIQRRSVRRIVILLIALLYAGSLTYYLHNYYVHYPVEFSREWQYGYREALRETSKIQDKYDRIVITDSIGRPYMYTLFYTRTDPEKFIRDADVKTDAAGFYHVSGFDKYRFGGNMPFELAPKTLYVWDAGMLPKGARLITTVRLLNGDPVLNIFDNGSAQL